MYNFKHIAILLATVFISLGIGIAVGFTANSDKLLIKQQKAIIDQLENSFNILKENNRIKDQQLKLLIEEQKRDYEFLEHNFKTLLKGSIEGKKGTVLQLGKKIDSTTEVIKYLEDAGAVIQTSSILNDDEKEDKELNNIIEAFLDKDVIDFNDFVVIVRADENLNPGFIARKISDIKPVAIVQSSNLSRLDITTSKKLLYIDDIDTIMGKYRLIVWLINNS
ncbi:Copper transport outer membrane protein, MctB [Caldanaerovirga acetigignens]|uniref:Copper transport outer membrane protein, MctB n=1 Tax=Caldanaerovirga acetigignens TaxID=447595 RepID=A0A1M7JDS3_9FIRM|nr:copper transporter [Caldanaerovirga acetigignens]SHM51041.1 Copper transport outer membrane protein, MctB [Caldanaerovirga acetigignens]